MVSQASSVGAQFKCLKMEQSVRSGWGQKRGDFEQDTPPSLWAIYEMSQPCVAIGVFILKVEDNFAGNNQQTMIDARGQWDLLPGFKLRNLNVTDPQNLLKLPPFPSALVIMVSTVHDIGRTDYALMSF